MKFKKFKIKDENGNKVKYENENQKNIVDHIIHIREKLEELADELIGDMDCSVKHRIFENAFFNMWRYQLICLFDIDESYVENILEDELKIIGRTLRELSEKNNC
jgi:hypothetical protein